MLWFYNRCPTALKALFSTWKVSFISMSWPLCVTWPFLTHPGSMQNFHWIYCICERFEGLSCCHRKWHGMIYSLFSTSRFVCMNNWLQIQSSELFIRQSCSTFTGVSVPVKSTWGNNTILIHIHSLTHPPLADHRHIQISFQISPFSFHH